jgi:hypothetical protein
MASDKLETLYRERDEALERLLVAFEKCEANDEGEDAGEQFNCAADAFALAQVAISFEIHH